MPHVHTRCTQDMIFTVKTMMGSQQKRGQERELKISEARAVLEDVESERLISDDSVRASPASD